MSNPYQDTAPSSSNRGCALGIVGVVLGLGLGCLVIPVIIIAALTVLGNSISGKFDKIQAEICAEHPDDPKCR